MRKFFLSLLLAAAGLGGAHAAEVINLAIGEWAPFTSEKDPKGKLLETVVTEAFKLEGIEVKYSYYPWKRSSTMVEEGQSDGSFPWGKIPEREATFVFAKSPVMTDESVYFFPKSVPFDWKTIDDLKKYKVGVTIGYKNETVYKNKGIAAESVPQEELNFKKLAAGRLDVYETSKEVGYALIAKHLTPEEAKLITHHPKASEQMEYYIFFSKKNPKAKMYADKFDSGLAKLKASGGYAKIFAK
ncbi:transporter substrate-binding domain-containing protein [Curvibacter sp. APW13]|uniref:substrate-binding periplasmic protein n=1 Tax=Curvibacter sp. APW13 TaxID=3077236 RepID=UPI0028DD9EAD|nr:transporter substrate-binding domain-containing protein [Curvibacter sp. APW13]MDT8989393.1 transporter substrate-binding domain-containing protein [Curvibacter sp. APW13]